MSYFYVQACQNGHFQITNRKLQVDSVCEVCGLPLMDKCPECGAYIRKWTLYGATPILPGKDSYQLPIECSGCGLKFPWSGTEGGVQESEKRDRTGGRQVAQAQQGESLGAGQVSDEMRMDSQFLLADMRQANGEAALVRKAYDEAAQKEYDTCSYAFFPGCQLGAAEPEIVIKAYDSIRFQHPDTAMFLQCCGLAANMAGERDVFQAVLKDIEEKWNVLGKPQMIMACPACQKVFRAHLPDIPVVSLYEMLRGMGVSGGCHSADYVLFGLGEKTGAKPLAGAESTESMDAGMAANPGGSPVVETGDAGANPGGTPGAGGRDARASLGGVPAIEAVSALAEDMGVKLHPAGEKTAHPYLVNSINQRDQLKREGKEAVHILELIFGMGESNLHLAHEHTHEHDDMEMHGDEPVCGQTCGTGGMNEPSNESVCGHEGGQQDGHEPVQEGMMKDQGEKTKGQCGGQAQRGGSAPLPDPSARWQNRLELKQALLSFFWDEPHE